MEKNQKIMIVVIIILVLIFIFRNKIKAMFAPKTIAPIYPIDSAATKKSSLIVDDIIINKSAFSNFPLSIGKRGSEVKALQLALGITSDGIFGNNTAAALKAKTGKTSVADLQELQKIISNAKTAIATKVGAAAVSKLFKNVGIL